MLARLVCARWETKPCRQAQAIALRQQQLERDGGLARRHANGAYASGRQRFRSTSRP